MQRSLASKLDEFTDAQDPAQLERMQRAIDEAFADTVGPAEVAALLGVFERFPEEDGYGIFWSILHGLEHKADYETELVASVKRAPNLFNTLMLHRIQNSGVPEVDGHQIRALLVAAEREPNTPRVVAAQLQSLLASQPDAQ